MEPLILLTPSSAIGSVTIGKVVVPIERAATHIGLLRSVERKAPHD